MRSLLFQAGATPFVEPPGCSALPCRQEIEINLQSEGRIYRFKLRDKIVPEDPYLVLVKAGAFALQVGEPYNGQPTGRAIKDFLIKDSVVI